MSHSPAPLGEIIGGYEVRSLIAVGSTAHVYLAHHALLGRPAAVKVLSPELVSNPNVVARLLTEARIVNDIRHANIVDIFDFVATDRPRRVALVMELVEGPSLMALRGYRFRFDQAIAIAIQLVEAVGAAHRAGVIHRDLKPGNLLLTEMPSDDIAIPTLKLVDFGIAKLAQVSGRTATGMMLGTPAYMAPEQIVHRPDPSPATDVYAIGEVLFELLTGRRAFPANKIHETVRAKLRGEPPELVLPNTVPEKAAIHEVIAACLARAPQDRPALDEVRALLGRVYPTAWRPASTGERVVAESLPRVPAYVEACTTPIELDAATIRPRREDVSDIDVTDDALQVAFSPAALVDPAVLCADLDIDVTRTGEHAACAALYAPTELELVIDTTHTDTAMRPFARTANDVAWLLEDESLDAPTNPGRDAPPIMARRSLGAATAIEHDELLAEKTEAFARPTPLPDAPTVVPGGLVIPTRPASLDDDDAPWEPLGGETCPDIDPADRLGEPSRVLGVALPSISDPATLRSAPWHLSRLAPSPLPVPKPAPRPARPTRWWPVAVTVGLIFAGSVGCLAAALHGAV